MKDLREILQHHLERNGLNYLATASTMEIVELIIRQERIKAQGEVIETMQNLDEYRDLVKYLAANYEVMKLTNLLDKLKQSLEKGENEIQRSTSGSS